MSEIVSLASSVQSITVETSNTILAADIGGTNSRLVLYEIGSEGDLPIQNGQEAPGAIIFEKNYLNCNYDSFTSIVEDFLNEVSKVSTSPTSLPPRTACLAVAGPVKNNRVLLTNRGWDIVGEDISSAFNIKTCRLINDFVAVGYGLLTLNRAVECLQLQEGDIRHDAPIACIGPGTGLGECFLTPSADGSYQCFPSEGSHAEFSPKNEEEVGLLNFLKNKFHQANRVSIERVVSGSGLLNVFEYLCATHPDKVNVEIVTAVSAAGDLGAAEIAKHGSDDELCGRTMDIFATHYGSEAGVAALKWLPFGGTPY